MFDIKEGSVFIILCLIKHWTKLLPLITVIETNVNMVTPTGYEITPKCKNLTKYMYIISVLQELPVFHQPINIRGGVGGNI